MSVLVHNLKLKFSSAQEMCQRDTEVFRSLNPPMCCSEALPFGRSFFSALRIHNGVEDNSITLKKAHDSFPEERMYVIILYFILL
jgi:hypothetical protein